MIKGISITLYDKVQSGTDDFNRPIETETPVTVDNVLVYPSTSEEITDTLNLSGKKAVYTLGIPKGDNHVWKDRNVGFFGDTFHTIGEPISGIEANIPLSWNMKVEVEIIE